MAPRGKTTEKDGHDKSGVAKFPKFPGENFLAHAGAQYQEAAETALALRSYAFSTSQK